MWRAPPAAAALTTASRSPAESVMPGRTGEQLTPTAIPAALRLQNPGQVDVQSGDGHMDRKLVVPRYFAQQFEVSHHKIRLGHNSQLEAAMAGELFENGARDFVAPLGWLVGIGRCTERDGLTRLDSPQFLPQQFPRILLDVNLLLEIHAVPHFHEFVSVAGIAVAAAEFAPAIRIDGPGEGQRPAAHAAVQQRLRRKREVFNLMPLAQRFALRRQSGDSDQRGLVGKRKQG